MEADLKAAASAAGGGLADQTGRDPARAAATTPTSSTAAIPAINFFTGFHPDYHRPTDDWDKIDAAGTKRVATLALELAARLAERDDSRPEFSRAAERTPRRRYEYAGVGRCSESPLVNTSQLLAQHQPAAMQTRLERLILHLQPAARLFGGQTFDVSQHDRRAIDLGQLSHGRGQRDAQLLHASASSSGIRDQSAGSRGVRGCSPASNRASARSRSCSAILPARCCRSRDIAVLNVMR